ncbi:helix-turn-helix domain-containing protein [Nocardioides perillae]|uniref:Excisionase family DNA binding protein n=1 Tax=Nocardioides perillae TaxID=1119534 RepID=A0A7Y9RTX9_9ACTN|nr:helix-turn-helix domain-containing protein [Nocardioides perillae]NYG55279.1 excisionase family DNA binding protein [Nocardioides perillae]
MKTLETSNIPVDQLDELDQFAATAGPELRDVLMSLSRCVREGDEVVVIDGSKTVTPSQAAERLGMSRTHLYKLLDRGEIVFHRVGRDRRIRVHDLLQFEEQRQRDRRELAERFAHQRQTAAAATDEIADLL